MLVAMVITRDVLINILAATDPVGLIAGGAPQDEYAAEADAILALQGVPKVIEITGVFAVSFSEPRACTRDSALDLRQWCAEQADEARCAVTGSADDRDRQRAADLPELSSRSISCRASVVRGPFRLVFVIRHRSSPTCC